MAAPTWAAEGFTVVSVTAAEATPVQNNTTTNANRQRGNRWTRFTPHLCTYREARLLRERQPRNKTMHANMAAHNRRRLTGSGTEEIVTCPFAKTSAESKSAGPKS